MFYNACLCIGIECFVIDTLSPCFVNRYLSSCGILMTRAPLLFRGLSGRAVVAPARSFFNLSESFNKRKEYSERRIIGYVPSQAGDDACSVAIFIFIDVRDYVHCEWCLCKWAWDFLWCRPSEVIGVWICSGDVTSSQVTWELKLTGEVCILERRGFV